MIVIVKFHRKLVDGIHIFIQTQKIKESLITIAGNRGTPLTLKLLLARTSCFLMFPREKKFNKGLSIVGVAVEKEPLDFVRQDGDAYLNNLTTVLKTFPILLLRVSDCITFAS